jgi:hypothetical protein
VDAQSINRQHGGDQVRSNRLPNGRSSECTRATTGSS